MGSIKKNYLLVIIFGILSALLIVFVIYPLFKKIGELSYSLFLEENKITYLNQEREELRRMENLYKTYQADLDKMENLFIDPEVPVEFINFLEKNAADSQIKLEISSMTKETKKGDVWPSLSLHVLVTGSFSNFSKFLDKLENSSYLIETSDFNARKLSDKEKQAEENKNIPEADTTAVLSIKVFTK